MAAAPAAGAGLARLAWAPPRLTWLSPSVRGHFARRVSPGDAPRRPLRRRAARRSQSSRRNRRSPRSRCKPRTPHSRRWQGRQDAATADHDGAQGDTGAADHPCAADHPALPPTPALAMVAAAPTHRRRCDGTGAADDGRALRSGNAADDNGMLPVARPARRCAPSVGGSLPPRLASASAVLARGDLGSWDMATPPQGRSKVLELARDRDHEGGHQRCHSNDTARQGRGHPARARMRRHPR